MALLFIEGFEQYTLTDEVEMARAGWGSPNGVTPSFHNLVAGRHAGGQAISVTANGAFLGHGFPATDVVTIGFAYKLLNSSPAGVDCMILREGTTQHLILSITAAGELKLERGPGTQLDITSGQGMTQGQWYYIELDATIHNSTGAYEVFIDGVSVMSGTSQDTQNGGTASVDNFYMTGNAAIDPTYDDIYVLDDAGTDNTGPLGDCRVETIFPDGAGNEADFTASPAVSNYLNVDDGITPDDDTTYNWSATATDRDLYAFEALSGAIDTIFGVDAKMLVRKEDAGTREIRVIARNGTTEVESASLSLGMDWGYRNNIFENNPDGGGDWTEATVNTAQFGLDLHT